jgi:cell division protein FtsQ
LGGALAVGVSTVVAVAARRYVSTSPRFAVTEVVVTGAKQRATGDLIALAGFEKGKNIFSADLDGARDRLLADPWLKDVALARRLPGTLYIDVVEREAAAILNLEDTYLISRDGELIKRLEGHDPGDLTVITGVEPDHYARDKKGAEQEIRSALDLADEYEASLMGKRYPLQAVHVQRGGEMTLLVGKTSVALVMGKKPYRGKLEQAAKVLQEVEHQGAQADAVMLDNEARPDRIVVRMR